MADNKKPVPVVKLPSNAFDAQDATDQDPAWLRGVFAENYALSHPETPAAAMIRARRRQLTGAAKDLSLPKESRSLIELKRAAKMQ